MISQRHDIELSHIESLRDQSNPQAQDIGLMHFKFSDFDTENSSPRDPSKHLNRKIDVFCYCEKYGRKCKYSVNCSLNKIYFVFDTRFEV